MTAIDHLDADAARAALDAGADANAADDMGFAPLVLAVGVQGFGCPPSPMTATGKIREPKTFNRCLLDSAYATPSIVRKRRLALARLLLEHGADVNGRGPRGDPPLVASFSNWPSGSDEVVRLLLSSGADVNRPSPSTGKTALHEAAAWGAAPIVRLLLQHHARVDAEDNQRMTPLSWAAQGGRREAVSILLAAGADPTHKDASGDTPAATARQVMHPDIAKMIEKAAARPAPGH